jgi:hypothetical protein
MRIIFAVVGMATLGAALAASATFNTSTASPPTISASATVDNPLNQAISNSNTISFSQSDVIAAKDLDTGSATVSVENRPIATAPEKPDLAASNGRQHGAPANKGAPLKQLAALGAFVGLGIPSSRKDLRRAGRFVRT